MPLALTCDCGAHLEIDDKFAGQTITCPDCQRPLQAPALAPVPRRTSGLALSSLVLALVGAFTVVGTVIAVILGVVAIVQISLRPDRLAGRGYALAGIAVGVLMTAGTVFTLSSIELYGLTGIMSTADWSGKLEYPDGLDVVRKRADFKIKRPSDQWGVYKPPSAKDSGDVNQSLAVDLLLVLPEEDAIILCYSLNDRKYRDWDIERCRLKVADEFRKQVRDGEQLVGPFSKSAQHGSVTLFDVHDIRRPPVKDGIETAEMQIDMRKGGEDKSFLIGVFKAEGDDRIFVVIAGCHRSKFARLQPQFREALKSFRILNARGD
jgi:hypothetical protein